MANEKNLIPFGSLPPEEERIVKQRGALASAEAKRRKRDLKRALDQIYTANIPNKQLHALLEEMGVDPTSGNALALVLFQKALNGDESTIDKIMNILDDGDYH